MRSAAAALIRLLLLTSRDAAFGGTLRVCRRIFIYLLTGAAYYDSVSALLFPEAKCTVMSGESLSVFEMNLLGISDVARNKVTRIN